MTWQMIIYLSAAAAGASLLGFGGWKGWQLLKAYLARPKKYFIRTHEEAHAKALRDAGLDFETGQAPDGSQGLIVKYDRLNDSVAALSASHTASLMLDGNKLHEAVLAFPHENANAFNPTRIGVWFARRDKKVAARVQKVVHNVLAGRINLNFAVSLDPGVRTMRERGYFHICFGSTPKTTEKQTLPARLFDIELEPQQVWRFTGLSAPVTDPASGHIVGEFSKEGLHIYADFWQMGEEQRLALLTRVLQRLLVERDPAAFLKEVVEEEGEGIPKPAARQSIADEGFADAEERAVVRATLHAFLSPFVREEIHVKNCQGITQPPLDDGMFHVFFNSSAGGRPNEPVPAKMLGCDLIRRDKAFGPSGLGVPLFEKDGFVYAELVGSNLYIHQHLLTHSSKSEAKLLARLFVKVGQLIEKQQSRRGGPRFTEQDLQDELALILSSTTGATSKKGEPVSDAELSKALRDSLNADLEVYRLEHSGSEELGREFDELCRVYKVLSVQVKQRTIVVTTDMLYCVDPRSGKRHEIGEFKITIPMDNSTQVTWMNQTRTMRIDGRTMHAPHVSAHGHACFGNTQDLFPMLIKKREFASAVQVAIAFVESVNVSDNWGRGISQWPEAIGNVT
ncbi:MAG: hypothetical protein IT343_21940 [Candidatus Melainabacteria bacterium]|jgi:hypothetical protein|nr:hypothetical protein [Candidatus Melainabacteria bacterium]